MNSDLTDINAETLAATLEGDGPATLSTEQVALVRSLLEQFAADQITLLALQRRLARYEQSGERIDRSLTTGLNLVASRLDRPAADQGFDFAASRQIRDDLAEQVARADRADEIWVAAARAAIRLVSLL